MSFRRPEFLAIAVVVACLFALAIWLLQRRRAQRTLRYSNLAFLIAAAQPRVWPQRALTAAWALAAALIVAAAAQPRVRAWVPVRGGAAVLCVDTSGSMSATDVSPTRADAALTALRAFIRQSPAGTAIGLVSFAGDAQAIAAPTRDRDQLQAALAAIPAPNGATAIGDALSLALRILPKSGHRVVVLITDGENNAGSDPMQAARLLAAQHVKLYTIGIGTNAGALIPGTLQAAGIDEQALQAYAAATGGAYSRAGDAAELREALASLGRSTSFERRTVDVSLAAAIAGALVMAVTFLAGVAAGRYP